MDTATSFSSPSYSQVSQKIEERWNCVILLLAFVVTLGTTVPVGYSLGVVNALAETIQDWFYISIETRYKVVLSESKIRLIWYSIVSLFLLGGVIGSFVSAWYCDMYGRKGTLIISSFLLIISAFFVAFCKRYNSIEMLIIGRVIGGIAASLTITAQPMYLIELAPMSYQGTVGSFTCIGMTFGILISQIVTLPFFLGCDELWPFAFGGYCLFVLLFLLVAYWLPESPRWLFLIKDNPYKAEANLMRLRKNAELVELEMKSMKDQHIDEDTKGIIQAICDSDLLVPFILVCSYQICQQMSGINAIFYYSVGIFVDAGFSTKMANWITLGLGCVNLVASLFSPIIINSVNRRPMLMTSFTGCGISLFVFSFTLNSEKMNWTAVLSITFMVTFLLFYQTGIGPISFFIGSELFEVGPRPAAMSMGSLCNWTSNFLIAICFPPIYIAIGSYSFLPCVGICVFGFGVTYFLLPETRQKTPKEVAQQLAHFHRKRRVSF